MGARAAIVARYRDIQTDRYGCKCCKDSEAQSVATVLFPLVSFPVCFAYHVTSCHMLESHVEIFAW